jgi:molybdopterin/thiamine biosynthesis adenylyltransferase
MKTNNKPTICFPAELVKSTYTGKLLGYSHPASNYYNIIATGEAGNIKLEHVCEIGSIINQDSNGNYFGSGSVEEELNEVEKISPAIGKPAIKKGEVLGIRRAGEISFETSDGVICKNEPYSLISDVFSRNTGILETGFMLDKTAIISGCGSVGSLVALELARAGVGNFLLIDNDVLSYHNLCRHQCGIADVGRFKVDAVADKILQVNPAARIHTEVSIIENIGEKVFIEWCNKQSIILGCADNREGDVYANKIAKLFKVPFISIGLWERAFAGEIFYTLYNSNPCYSCLYEAIGGLSARRSMNNRFYTTEEDASRLNFEPGISADIGYVTLIAVKIAIDIFNLGNSTYHQRLLPHLSQFTLICNTNNKEVAGAMGDLFSFPLQVTTNIDIAYSGTCVKENSCKLFSTHAL